MNQDRGQNWANQSCELNSAGWGRGPSSKIRQKRRPRAESRVESSFAGSPFKAAQSARRAGYVPGGAAVGAGAAGARYWSGGDGACSPPDGDWSYIATRLSVAYRARTEPLPAALDRCRSM